MKKQLNLMSVDDLIGHFAEIALQQDQAILLDQTAKFRKLYWAMDEVEQELKSRLGDQRHKLMTLYDHDNVQVRLKAAEATLAVAPEAARLMLESISNSRKYPQAGDAGMLLLNLDRGTFKPT
jgi:hypothetical protein